MNVQCRSKSLVRGPGQVPNEGGIRQTKINTCIGILDQTSPSTLDDLLQIIRIYLKNISFALLFY